MNAIIAMPVFLLSFPIPLMHIQRLLVGDLFAVHFVTSLHLWHLD